MRRSTRHNLKLPQGLKPRFSEPFDDFLARLLDSLDTFCARRNPEREHDQQDNDNPCDVIPSSLAAAAFGAAPKGSNWTVWVSHELMVRFKSTKDRFCPGAKHGEFVELLFLLQSLESSPDRDTSQLVPAAVALNVADSIAPSTQPPSSPVEKSTDRTDGWGKYLPGNSRRRSIPLRASELSTASDPPDSGLSRKRSVLQTCELLIKGIGRKQSIPSTQLPRANPPSLAEASPSYSLLPFLFPNNTTRRPDDVLPPYLDHVSGANATHDPPSQPPSPTSLEVEQSLPDAQAPQLGEINVDDLSDLVTPAEVSSTSAAPLGSKGQELESSTAVGSDVVEPLPPYFRSTLPLSSASDGLAGERAEEASLSDEALFGDDFSVKAPGPLADDMSSLDVDRLSTRKSADLFARDSSSAGEASASGRDMDVSSVKSIFIGSQRKSVISSSESLREAPGTPAWNPFGSTDSDRFSLLVEELSLSLPASEVRPADRAPVESEEELLSLPPDPYIWKSRQSEVGELPNTDNPTPLPTAGELPPPYNPNQMSSKSERRPNNSDLIPAFLLDTLKSVAGDGESIDGLSPSEYAMAWWSELADAPADDLDWYVPGQYNVVKSTADTSVQNVAASPDALPPYLNAGGDEGRSSADDKLKTQMTSLFQANVEDDAMTEEDQAALMASLMDFGGISAEDGTAGSQPTTDTLNTARDTSLWSPPPPFFDPQVPIFQPDKTDALAFLEAFAASDWPVDSALPTSSAAATSLDPEGTPPAVRHNFASQARRHGAKRPRGGGGGSSVSRDAAGESVRLRPLGAVAALTKGLAATTPPAERKRPRAREARRAVDGRPYARLGPEVGVDRGGGGSAAGEPFNAAGLLSPRWARHRLEHAAGSSTSSSSSFASASSSSLVGVSDFGFDVDLGDLWR